jgi:predicted RNase H-like HicB family nuclease
MDDYRFSVVIGKNGNGWAATCPEFGDCEAHGGSYEEVLANIRQAIQVRIEDCLGDNEEISQTESVNFTVLHLRL